MPNTEKDKTKGRRPDDSHLAQQATIEGREDEQRSTEEVAEEMRQQIQAGKASMPAEEVEEGVITGSAPPTTEAAPTPTPEDSPVPANTDASNARALAAMRQELDEQKAEIARLSTSAAKSAKVQGTSGDESFPWQIYRRPDEHIEGEANQAGWLTVAPGGATSAGRRDVGSFAKYSGIKGFKPITKYGPVDVPTTGKPGHEFFPMLERGGAVEFPVAQVIAYKWHLKPPIPGLVFPQVAEAIERGEVHRFRCEECTAEWWFIEGDTYTLQTCFTHLTKPMAQGGLHAYKREEAALALKSQKLPAVGRLATVAEEERRAELATPADDIDSRPSQA